MPHAIALPTDLSNRTAQIALYTQLIGELTDLQNALAEAIKASTAGTPRAAQLQELFKKDKATLRDMLTQAEAGLNSSQDVSGLLSRAVTAHNTIVDGLKTAPVVARPAVSTTGTHVMPAVVETPTPRVRSTMDAPAPQPRPAAVAPVNPPAPYDARVAATPVPPVPPRGGDRPTSGCTPTAAHVLELISRMPQRELDELRRRAGEQGGRNLLGTLLTERGGRRGEHR